MKLADSLGHISHHAYAIVGGEAAAAELIQLLQKQKFVRILGNPDFFNQSFETFTIDDARELKSRAETKPVEADVKKVFIIQTNGITIEAQNALLKLLEEPPSYAHFFLIIPSAHLLLPTVKSRLTLIQQEPNGAKGKNANDGQAKDEIAELAADFVKAPTAKRLDMIKKFIDEITKEKRPRQDALDLLNELEVRVHEAGVKKNVSALEALEIARTYMYDRAPSLKMLLEYVALAI